MMRYPTLVESIGVILILIVVMTVYQAHKDKDNHFSFLDLLMENGKASKIACMTMGTWAALMFVFIGMYFDGKMTEGLVLAVGGLCFTPLVARMFSSAPPTSIASSTTTTTSTAEITK